LFSQKFGICAFKSKDMIFMHRDTAGNWTGRKFARLLGPLLFMAMPSAVAGQQRFYDFVVKDIYGEDFDLARLKGKKVLVVNTASECGFTPQFEDLEKLYREYGGDRFVIIGFPTNDFAHQDPGSNEEIAAFCKQNYGVTFPMMSKITVRGKEMHPLYRWLTKKSRNGVENSRVRWNFQKYLIDEEGRLVGHVVPRKNPYNRKIISWIEEE
jgi:glutathione peroxidase